MNSLSSPARDERAANPAEGDTERDYGAWNARCIARRASRRYRRSPGADMSPDMKVPGYASNLAVGRSFRVAGLYDIGLLRIFSFLAEAASERLLSSRRRGRYIFAGLHWLHRCTFTLPFHHARVSRAIRLFALAYCISILLNQSSTRWYYYLKSWKIIFFLFLSQLFSLQIQCKRVN